MALKLGTLAARLPSLVPDSILLLLLCLLHLEGGKLLLLLLLLRG